MPASKRPKKGTDSKGIERLQKARGSLNAGQETEIRPSISTPAELDENGIRSFHETTLQTTGKRSGHASTMLEDRGTPALGASQETSGLTNLETQSSSPVPEGLNNDTIKARGFGRLSGLSARAHIIYSGMRLTSQKQSTEQLKLLPHVKQRLRFS